MKNPQKKQSALSPSLFSVSLPLRRALNLAILTALYPAFAYANPNGAQVVSGQVSIDTATPGVTTVTNSPNAIINWQNFSIAQHELTQFIQQNGQSAVLNRIIGQNPSEILGQLTSNGKVFLINPNGIVFGAGSAIDTQGLIASSLNLSDQDFLSGNYHFMAGSSAGNILNEGIIRAGKDGNIILIAPKIENNGIIKSDGGSITLAAGQEMTITNLDNPDIRFQIQAPADSVLNLGKLLSEGGAINVFASTITHSGEINADSVQIDKQGHIQLVAQQDITLAAGSKISANNSQGDAGTIHVDSKTGTTLAQGAIEAQATQTGKGGKIELLGEQVGMLDQAKIDASGQNGGGQVLIGGDYQGKNLAVHNAKAAYVGKDSIIKADAKTTGNGGKVIVWSDNATRAYGDISAKGGSQSGNGGFIETSGHWLDTAGIRINASALNGIGGEWLLDPYNITIDAFGPSTPGPTFPSWTAGAINSVILNTDINTQLNNGTNVTIYTGGAVGADAGNITVAANISKTSGGAATLFLNADNNIIINNNITSTAWPLNVTLKALNDININADIIATTRTLSAGNDIIVSSPITAPATGSYGNTSMQAGRNILVNANITSPLGFTATANSTWNLGVGRGVGAGAFTMAPGTTISTVNYQGGMNYSDMAIAVSTQGVAGSATIYNLSSDRSLSVTADNFSFAGGANSIWAYYYINLNSQTSKPVVIGGTGTAADFVIKQSDISALKSPFFWLQLGGGTLGTTVNSLTFNAGNMLGNGVISIANGGTVTLAGNVDTLNKPIQISTPNFVQNVGASLSAGTNSIKLSVDNIALNGSVGSFTTGGMSIEQLSVNRPLLIGASGTGAELALKASDLAVLNSSVGSLTFGKWQGSGNVIINSANFNVPVSFPTDGPTNTLTIADNAIFTTNGGSINFGYKSSFIQGVGSVINAGAGSISIGGQNIDLRGSPGSIIGGGTLSLNSWNYSAARPFVLGAVGTASDFALDNNEIATFAKGFSQINFGSYVNWYSDGATINTVSFLDPVRFYGSGGTITINGPLSVGGLATFADKANILGNITSTGGLSFNTATTIGVPVLLNGGAGDASFLSTVNAGANSVGVTANNIIINGLFTAGLLNFNANLSVMLNNSIITNGNDFSAVATNGGVLINNSTLNTGAGSINIRGTRAAGSSGLSGIGITNSNLVTTGGNIALDGATTLASASGGSGVFMSTTSLNAGAGNISIRGSGSGSSSSEGIGLVSSSLNTTSGYIYLNGVSGAGTGIGNEGVSLISSSLTTTGGALSVTGTNQGTGSNNMGILVQSSSLNAGTGNLTLNGTGGNGPSTNYGVGILNSSLDTTAGAMNINGTGRGTGSSNSGIYINSAALRTGTGNLTLNGTGGNGTDNNYGIEIREGSNASTTGNLLSTQGGALSITGTGMGAGIGNSGIYVFTKLYKTQLFSGSGTMALNGYGVGSAFGMENHGLRPGGLLQTGAINIFSNNSLRFGQWDTLTNTGLIQINSDLTMIAANGDITLNGPITAGLNKNLTFAAIGGRFINNFVATPSQNTLNVSGTGRWLIYSKGPAGNVLGDIAPTFELYGCLYATGCTGASIPTTGNGLLYSDLLTTPVSSNTVTTTTQTTTAGVLGTTQSGNPSTDNSSSNTNSTGGSSSSTTKDDKKTKQCTK